MKPAGRNYVAPNDQAKSPTSPTQTALYARVSTSRQDLDLHLEELRDFSARREWAISGVYEDVVSGASTRRPGLDRLLADAHAGRFDVVGVWKLDRLGRSLIHMIQVVDDLLGKGVHVVSSTEPHMDSTTPQGRLMRNIFGSVAEYERELIRERVTDGLTRARAKGIKLGRPARPVNLEELRRRRTAGQGWRKIARALKTPTSTLRRRFEACQKPPSELRHATADLAGDSGRPEGGAET
jgi:DNA invertase Pin-like site-specific DNA recombinase